MTSRNMGTTSRGLRRAAETCTGQARGLAAVIQARIRRCSRVHAAGSDCLSSRRSRKTRSFVIMFHMKHVLFLPMFHVRQTCFSVRQAAARPIPSLRCHSERSKESPNFEANPSSTCGDSSSQAPQNDKEKRNAGVSHPKSRLFHVKHHSDPPYMVPFPMRD